MLSAYSVNDNAVRVIEEEMRPNQAGLQIKFHTCQNGATVIDMGVHQPAGFQAGKYFTQVSLGGLGQLRFTKTKYGKYYIPCATMFVDHPHVAELAAHCAFLRVHHCGVEKNFSGPARAKHHDDYSAATGYHDAGTKYAVVAYQIDYLPAEGLVAQLAEKVGVRPENLYLMVARTGTMTGSIHIAARNVEQTVPTLLDKGFPVASIVHAMGTAPILPPLDDEWDAYGRVNDALIYGQETNLWVDCEDEAITSLTDRLTMDQPGNGEVYGRPFKEIFASCNNDWCQLPREWDAPSKVNFYNLRTGNSFSVGSHNKAVLLADFLGESGGKTNG